MEKSIILCCAACYLLSAFPGITEIIVEKCNYISLETREKQSCSYCCPLVSIETGSKLNDSLRCIMEFSKNSITCSWSEGHMSRQYFNMTLVDRTRGPMCEDMEPVKMEASHVTWTCHRNFSHFKYYDDLNLTFQPDRSLESHLNVSNEGDEAKPKNMHCVVSGDETIHCSWEVRQNVADSFDFALYYHNESQKEEVCRPRCWQEIPKYLSCACNFTARHDNDPIHLLNISVGPVDPETSSKYFLICKHIKLRARNLTIKEKSQGETFLISWDKDPNEKSSFQYHYELCYWRKDDVKSDEVAPDCPGQNKTLSPNNDPEVSLKMGTQLQSGSVYYVKVRVQLRDVKEDYCYRGPWSEWSTVQTFHTKSVPNTLLLCILVLSAVAVLTICSICGFRALVRYKKRWDNRIPNPSKSAIIKSLQKAKDRLVIRYLTLQNGPSFLHEEHLYVEPFNKIMMWAPLKQDIGYLKEEEQTSRSNSEMFQDDDTQCLFLITEGDYPAASITDGYKPFEELMEEQEDRVSVESHLTVCAFDGPYLFS